MASEGIYSIFALPNVASNFLCFFHPVRAYAYYRSKRENLLTGLWEKSSCQLVQQLLNEEVIGQRLQEIQVWHFFYEWGYFYQGYEELIDEDQILVIEIRYRETKPWSLPATFGGSANFTLDFDRTLSYSHYQELFQQGYEQLRAGNCYQFNLAHRFGYRSQEPLYFEKFCGQLWSASTAPFAHGSYFPSWQKSIVSNSPEMHFKVTKKAQQFTLHSLPIKGTMALRPGENWQSAWQRLRASEKDEAELNMITDLLRNDLTRIEQRYCQIINKKMPLLVPKILHQYAHLAVEVSPQIGIGQILAALFPGGSITGAPKKKVMEILKSLELSSRGIYTGSTLLRWQHTNIASINIRTAMLDHQRGIIEYGSGGGITLLSRPWDEYCEMLLKRESFFAPFF